MDPTRVNEHEREQEGGMGRVHDMSDVYPSSDTLVFSGARENYALTAVTLALYDPTS